MRKVAFTALVGSHNYNLSTPESDKDYKHFVWPSFEDLYCNRYHHESKVTEDQDYEVHDIRRLGELLTKSNPNYLEVLFSQSIVWEDVELQDFLMDNRNRIAIMNRPKLWSSIFGLGTEKESKLMKGTSGTADLVEKFGYDTKQAMHAYRAYELISLLVIKDWNFGKSIWLEDGRRDFYLNIKKGCYSLETIKDILEGRREHAKSLEFYYKDFTQDMEMQEKLNDFIKTKVKQELIKDKK